MRSKAPLTLIEQAIMLLVFSLAAVLCLKAFVWADSQSVYNAARDQALLQAQSAAESLKAAGGDVGHAQAQTARRMGGQVSQGLWYICYDKSWQETGEAQAVYRLEVREQTAPVEGLCQAQVRVSRQEDGQTLCSLTVAWQEVDANA